MTLPHDDIPDFARHLVELSRAVLQSWPGRSLVAGYLYGSALGARCRTDSDLDIAILDDVQDRLGWQEQAILMDQLERSTGYPVDLRMLRDGLPSYQKYVLNDGLLIWLRDQKAVDFFAWQVAEDVRKESERNVQGWDNLIASFAARDETPQ